MPGLPVATVANSFADCNTSGARERTVSRIFQPARKGFISQQPSCIGYEVATTQSLGGGWIGDPIVAPPASASCHPAVSNGCVAQAGARDDVVYTAGGRGIQCHEASCADSHFQKHPDSYQGP